MGIDDLEKYTANCLKELTEKFKREDFKSAKKLLEEKISELENWWNSLPPPMKEYFDKKYKKCYEILSGLIEELSMYGY